MSQMTYETLKIEGLPITHIKRLEIHQKINEHGTGLVWGETNVETAHKFLEKATENMVIKVKNEDRLLFCGILSDLSVQYENDYAILCASLISTTQVLDCQVQSHSYQCSGDTYIGVMQKSAMGNGEVVPHIADKMIGGIIVQYRETSWSFIKRLAADMHTFAAADVTAVSPRVVIGTLGEAAIHGRRQAGSNTQKGVTEEFVYAGMKADGQIICEVKSMLEAGVLRSVYYLKKMKDIAALAELQGTKSSPAVSLAGKVFAGVVKGVNRDLVQIHLTSIDQDFDAGGDWWFPYSTLYSSTQNDAGIYCMPKSGDPVRVFFPTNEPKDAFAASSMTVRGNRSDKEEKCFHTQSGMEVLLGRQGLNISCKGKKVYINLDKDKGIQIRANTSITMKTAANFGIMAYDNLRVTSQKEIFVGTPGSFLDIEDGSIRAMAPKIFVK